MLALVGLIKLAAAVDFFAGARFGVAFLADDVLFAGAATDAAAFAFGVSFFALVEVLVAAAPTFFVEEDGFASWNSCPAQPNTKAMTTTVAAIPKGCVKSPINVSGFADALDIFAFVFCRISFCWCVFFGGEGGFRHITDNNIYVSVFWITLLRKLQSAQMAKLAISQPAVDI